MAEYVTLITLRIAPERAAEFEAMMAVEAPLTRGFEGCELFEAYAGAPGEMLFLEHWRTKAHSDRYTAWRTERGDMERLGAFFVAPPANVVLRQVAAAE